MGVFEGLQWVQVLSKRKFPERLPSTSVFFPNLSFRDSRGTSFETPASTLIYSKLRLRRQ